MDRPDHGATAPRETLPKCTCIPKRNGSRKWNRKGLRKAGKITSVIHLEYPLKGE